MGSEKLNGDQLSNALLDVSLDDTSVPEPYVMPAHLLPKVAHDEFGHQKIPVIDLGGFQSCEGPEYKGIVSQLGDACENWGFFQVVNHGVKLELLKRVEAASLRFFALPLEEKQKVAAHFAGDRVLGYGFLKLRTSMRAWSEGVYVDTSCIAEYSKLLWPDDEDIQHSFWYLNSRGTL